MYWLSSKYVLRREDSLKQYKLVIRSLEEQQLISSVKRAAENSIYFPKINLLTVVGG